MCRPEWKAVARFPPADARARAGAAPVATPATSEPPEVLTGRMASFVPPPPPPPGWRWPRDGDKLEVEVEGDDGVARWQPAVVLQLLVDGSFQACIQVPGDPFNDWFTWEDEGKDWRRAGHSSSQSKGARVVSGQSFPKAPQPPGSGSGGFTSTPPPPAAGGDTFASAPPPPAGWTWPHEGERIEVEVEGSDEAPAAWVPSRVLQVLVDGLVRVRDRVNENF